MAIVDYASLQSNIALYLNRQDLTSQIPVFIQLAEAKFNRELRVPQMQTATVGLTTTSSTIPLPTDFVAMYKLNITVVGACGWNYLWGPGSGTMDVQFISDQQADNLAATQAYVGLKNAFYTIYGTNIELVNQGPFTTAIPYTIKYYQKVPALSDSNSINWLILSSPDLYLYASLLEASSYLIDQDANIQLWGQARKGLMDSLQEQADQSRFPQSGLTARWTTF